MARILVIADDLTGANATGARFARTGLRVITVTPEHVAAVLEDYDVVVANTDSRNLPKEPAADLVADVVEASWPVRLAVKRIDSTLRGNIGAEIETLWREVRGRTPAATRVRVLLVPAFPSAGRTTAEGVQLLEGVPLERTEVAVDPLCPLHTSSVADILAGQTELPVRHVPVRRVARSMLTAELAAGSEPIVFCDALTDDYLSELAAAAAEVHRRDGTVWISADPGPTGALLAAALGLRGRVTEAGPLLAVVGSPTDLTRRQMETFLRSGAAHTLDVDTGRLTEDEHYRSELGAALAERLSGGLFPDAVVVRTVTAATEVAAMPLRRRQELPGLLARVIGTAIRDAGPSGVPSGLYTTGGEVTAALLEALDVHGCTVNGEVIPLAVYGTLAGGPLDGVPVISKGGLVGDRTTMADCIERLRQLARARLRHVHAEVSEHEMFLG